MSKRKSKDNNTSKIKMSTERLMDLDLFGEYPTEGQLKVSCQFKTLIRIASKNNTTFTNIHNPLIFSGIATQYNNLIGHQGNYIGSEGVYSMNMYHTEAYIRYIVENFLEDEWTYKKFTNEWIEYYVEEKYGEDE